MPYGACSTNITVPAVQVQTAAPSVVGLGIARPTRLRTRIHSDATPSTSDATAASRLSSSPRPAYSAIKKSVRRPAPAGRAASQECDDRQKVIFDVASGVLANLIVTAATHPTDTIRNHMQASAKAASSVATARRIVAESGVQGLFTGMGSSLVFSVPQGAIYLGTYELLKGALLDLAGDEAETACAVASALGANLLAGIVSAPGEVIRHNQQLNHFGSPISAAEAVWATRGLRGFFAGYGVVMAKSVPNFAIRLGAYEKGKRALERWRGRRARWQESLAVGAAAGCLATAVCQPVDTLRTRLLSGDGAGPLRTAAAMLRAEGPGAFYRGLPMRLGMQVPASFTWYAVFEGTRTRLKARARRPAPAS